MKRRGFPCAGARRRALPSIVARVALVAGGVSACATVNPDSTELNDGLSTAARLLSMGELQATTRAVESLLPAALEDPEAELRAELLLMRAHLEASLGRPFATELTDGTSRALALAAPLRPSTDAHVVATIFHATGARALLEEVRDDGLATGVNLPATGDALRIVLGTAFARLGFRDAPLQVLDHSPALLRRDGFEQALAEAGLPRALATWTCALAFERLQSQDELEAYRYAILAIEGAKRFGCALPPAEVRRLERWILEDAELTFVCPESGTPYLPGTRRSPRSGILQLDYIGVPRD